MKKDPKLVRAAQLASLAKSLKATGGVFIYATLDRKLPNLKNVSAALAGETYTKHSCSNCSTEFASPAYLPKPFCITCGSDHLKVTAAKAKISVAGGDKSLAFFECAQCTSINVVGAKVFTSAGSGLHCAACGCEARYNVKANEVQGLDAGEGDPHVNSELPSGGEVDDLELVDTGDDGMAFEGQNLAGFEEDDEGPEGEEEPEEEMAMHEGPSVSELPNEGFTSTQQRGIDGISDEVTDLENDGETSTQQSPAKMGVADGITKPNAKGPEVKNESLAAEDEMDVNMVDTVDEDEEKAALAMLYAGDKVLLAANDTVIASLSANDAGEHASIMHTEEFRVAVGHTIASQGLKKALANYGFKPVVVSLPIKRIVEQRVTATVKERKITLEAALDSVKKDFEQSVDISAAGFAKNFWAGKGNVLYASLRTELEAAGLKSGAAKKILDRVFETSSVAYLRDVVDHARVLASMSVEARNGLSSAIDLGKYLPVRVQADAGMEGVEHPPGPTIQNQQEGTSPPRPLDVEADFESEDGDQGDEDGDVVDDVVARLGRGATPLTAGTTPSANKEQKKTFKSPELARILGDKPLFEV